MSLFNMQCRRARAGFSAYIDGECEDPAWLGSHIAACADCRHGFEQVQAIARGLDGLARQAAPAGFAERVMRAIGQQGAQVALRPARVRPALRVAFATAAVALIIVAFFTFRMETPREPAARPPVTTASAADLRAAAAEYESQGEIGAALDAYHEADAMENTASLDTARAYEKAGFAGEAAYRYAEIAFEPRAVQPD